MTGKDASHPRYSPSNRAFAAIIVHRNQKTLHSLAQYTSNRTRTTTESGLEWPLGSAKNDIDITNTTHPSRTPKEGNKASSRAATTSQLQLKNYKDRTGLLFQLKEKYHKDKYHKDKIKEEDEDDEDNLVAVKERQAQPLSSAPCNNILLVAPTPRASPLGFLSIYGAFPIFYFFYFLFSFLHDTQHITSLTPESAVG